jgi:hypothetical protein
MINSCKSEFARANGAKSRGPITPEGKLASSRNATQHGIFSRTMVLQCESQDRFEQVLAGLKLQVQPRNSRESGYVEMMVIARWRQMRVRAVQKATIELEMARLESASLEASNIKSARIESGNDVASQTAAADLTPVVLATLAYRTPSGNSFLDKFHRYETSYDRQVAQARTPSVECAVRNCSMPKISAQVSWTPPPARKKLFCKTNPRPKMKHE